MAVVNIKKVKDFECFSPVKFVPNTIHHTDKIRYLVICLKPGQKIKPHVHASRDHAYYVIKGEGVFEVDKKQYVAKEGDTLVTPGELAHALKNNSKENLVLLCFSNVTDEVAQNVPE